MTLPSEDVLRTHCREVIDLMAEGFLIPFLGPGVSLPDRSSAAASETENALPHTEELSLIIAGKVGYPWDDDKNLLRVSWYGARFEPEILHACLHDVFRDVGSTRIHKFFAELPRKLEAKGCRNRHLLIATTNYDRVLDDAFDGTEPYDLLSYVANSADKSEVGKFRYKTYDGQSGIVDDPNRFPPIGDNVLDRTMILKLRGGVDWLESGKSSFAVSDEDYIDYLARLNTPAYKIPTLLMEKMQDSSFLFLGFGVSEWNLRVVLRSIQSRKKFAHPSWAILHPIEQWDKTYWDQYGVELMDVPLNDYIASLEAELNSRPGGGGVV